MSLSSGCSRRRLRDLEISRAQPCAFSLFSCCARKPGQPALANPPPCLPRCPSASSDAECGDNSDPGFHGILRLKVTDWVRGSRKLLADGTARHWEPGWLFEDEMGPVGKLPQCLEWSPHRTQEDPSGCCRI